MPTTTITTIRTVAIPATDQDRSVAFFVDNLGFEKRMDAEIAKDFRWIEVAPPGSDVSVAIVAASSELPAASTPASDSSRPTPTPSTRR